MMLAKQFARLSQVLARKKCKPGPSKTRTGKKIDDSTKNIAGHGNSILLLSSSSSFSGATPAFAFAAFRSRSKSVHNLWRCYV